MTNAEQLTMPECTAPERIFTPVQKATAFIIIALAFGFMEFAVFHSPGILTSLVYIAIITCAVVFLRKNGCKFNRLTVAMTVVLYAFSLVFSLTDSGLVKFLDVVFLFFGGAYFMFSAANESPAIERYLPFAMTKAIFEYPFSHFGDQIAAVSSTMKNRSSHNLRNIIIGLILALLPTMIVGTLLSSADKNMDTFLSSLLENTFSEEGFRLIGHLLISLPCGFYLYGMFNGSCSAERSRLDPERCEESAGNLRFIDNVILCTSVTPILLLYVLFFVFQANYFLSAFSGTLPDGYSYAEYARAGFFELCAVTVINLAAIIIMNIFAKTGGKQKPRAMKFYITVLSIFTILLIAVDICKMVMYIAEYGLTRLRFYTMWFMLLCAVIFVLIIIKQFRFEMNFASKLVVSFTAMFALLCFSCPDSAIALYNIKMHEAGYLDELDVSQLCDMSDDAVLCAYEHGVISADRAAHEVYHIDEKAIDHLNLPAMMIRNKLKKAGHENDYHYIERID